MPGLLRRYRTYLARKATEDESRLFPIEMQWQAALWLLPMLPGGLICYLLGLTGIYRLIAFAPFVAISIFGWGLVWWESEPMGPT